MAKKRIEEKIIDPKRCERLESHLRDILLILENPKEKKITEELLTKWVAKTRIIIEEN